MTRLACRVALATGVIAGCAIGPSSPGQHTTLVVFAAASLEPAMSELVTAYLETHHTTDFTISADASSSLEARLEQGAPADMFLAADMTNPQKLVDAGLAEGAVIPFAANRLALIVPVANPGAVRKAADLARPGLRIVAAGEAVPVTTYAATLVANLAALPGYPPGFGAAYDSNIASREDSVAAVLAKVALGEGDAGIVYATDASSSDRVMAIPIPDAANVHAVYGGVTLRASQHASDAREFLGWLAGPGGQRVLMGLGFLSP